MAELTYNELINQLRDEWRTGQLTRKEYEDQLKQARDAEFFLSTGKHVLPTAIWENFSRQVDATLKELNSKADEIVARRQAVVVEQDPTLKPGSKPRTGVENLGRELLDNGIMALIGIKLALSPIEAITTTLGIKAQQALIASGTDVPIFRRFGGNYRLSDLVGAISNAADVPLQSILGAVIQAKGMIDAAKVAGAVAAQVEKLSPQVITIAKAAKEAGAPRIEKTLRAILGDEEFAKYTGILDQVMSQSGNEKAASLIQEAITGVMSVSERVKPSGLTATGERIRAALESAGVDISSLPRLPGESLEEAIRNKAVTMKLPISAPTLGEMIENIQSIISKQRRGIRPEGVSLTLGKQILEENPNLVNDLRHIAPGSIRNAEEFAAVQEGIRPIYEALGKSAAGAADGNAEAMFVFKGALEDLLRITPASGETTPLIAAQAGLKAETGRALDVITRDEAVNKMNDVLSIGYPQDLIDGDTTNALRALASDIADVWKQLGIGGVSEAGAKVIIGGLWKSTKEVFRNMLLVRPITAIANFTGAITGAGYAIARERVASIMGQTGIAPDVIAADQAAQMIRGFREGFISGLQTKVMPILKEQGPELSQITATRFEEMSRSLPGNMGTVVRTPGNILVATDLVIQDGLRYAWARAKYHTQAIRAGMTEGSDEYAKFLTSRMQNLPLDKNTMQEAINFSREFTFNDPFGPFMRGLQHGVQNSPLFFNFPFVRTLVRLSAFSMRLTPGLNLASSKLWQGITGSPEEIARATAEFAMANAFALSAFDLIQSGRVTGDGPINTKLNKLWQEAGNIPHTILNTIDMNSFQPWSTVLNAYASLVEATPYLSADDNENAAIATIVSFSRALTNSMWLRNAVTLFSAIGESTRGNISPLFKELVLDPAITIGTFGPLGAGIKRSLDDINREYHDFVGELRAKTPLTSTTQPAERNIWGEPIIRPKAMGGPAAEILFPLLREPKEPDVLSQHLLSIGFASTDLPDSILGPDTADQATAMAKPGQPMGIPLLDEHKVEVMASLETLRDPTDHLTVREAQTAIMDNPEYQAQTPAMQLQIQQNIYSAYQQAALANWIDKNSTNLELKLEASRSATSIELTKDPALRQELQDQYQKAVDGLLQQQQQGQ